VNTHALAMFKQGNLNAAVRAAATGLAAAPGHTDLRKTLQEILSGAEASANNARRAADASGVASRPEYGDASTRLKSADTSRRSGRSDDAEAAVRDYVAASQLYSAAVTRHAQTVLKQGNLAGATRVIVLGLGVLPGQGEFQKTLQEIFDAAEAGATGARRAADAAGASGRPEYVNATSQFTAASNARRSGRADGAEAAVRDFAAAEKLYKDAAAAAPPPPPPGVGPIVNSAKNFINIGNLTGAARTIAGGLKDFPKNSELLGTLQQIYGTAETEANTARKAADAAGASSRSEYAEGTSRLRSATNARSGRPEDAESVVRDYAAATKFYRDAERLGKEAVGGGGGGAISDEAAVRQVLAEYAVAYSSMDVARVRRVRPAFKPYDQNLRATELTISNPIVEFRDRETAVVTLTIQYRNAYRKGSFATDPPPQRVTWLLRRTNEGWKIQG
jgi:predicted Zn-dependent protease